MPLLTTVIKQSIEHTSALQLDELIRTFAKEYLMDGPADGEDCDAVCAAPATRGSHAAGNHVAHPTAGNHVARSVRKAIDHVTHAMHTADDHVARAMRTVHTVDNQACDSTVDNRASNITVDNHTFNHTVHNHVTHSMDSDEHTVDDHDSIVDDDSDDDDGDPVGLTPAMPSSAQCAIQHRTREGQAMPTYNAMVSRPVRPAESQAEPESHGCYAG